MRDHPPEDDLKLLRWSDEQLDGKGYVDWYAFDHDAARRGRARRLGHHVLPGATSRRSSSSARSRRTRSWALWHLLVSPRLEIRSLDVEALGEGSYLVRLVLAEHRLAADEVTEKAVERKAVRPLEVELTLPEGARLVGGEKKVELGQLDGRVHRRSLLWWATDDATSDRAKLEWVVEAPQGRWCVEARHQRAGIVRRELTLE